MPCFHVALLMNQFHFVVVLGTGGNARHKLPWKDLAQMTCLVVILLPSGG